MSKTSKKEEPPKEAKPRRPEDWKPAERLRIVMASEGLRDEALGEMLRREGLHQADVDAWRAAALEGLSAGSRPRANSLESRRVRELEKQLRRKDKALAETAALLVLSKKVSALWGDEDDDTGEKIDK